MKYEIEKVFVASTAHITQKDNELLTEESVTNLTPQLIVYNYEYGYYIYIGAEMPDTLSEYSPALQNLIKVAIENGCKYLKLDRDGSIYDNLATFNW